MTPKFSCDQLLRLHLDVFIVSIASVSSRGVVWCEALRGLGAGEPRPLNSASHGGDERAQDSVFRHVDRAFVVVARGQNDAELKLRDDEDALATVAKCAGPVEFAAAPGHVPEPPLVAAS